MAKKGGTTEIPGFIKPDTINKTKAKVSSRNPVAGTSIKSSVSNISKKEGEENNLKSKREIHKDPSEAKKTSESNVTKISKTTVNVSSKSRVQVSLDSTKKRTLNSHPTRDGVHKDQGINKTNKTENKPKSKPTEQKQANRRTVARDEGKSKPLPSGTPQKVVQVATNKNTDNIQNVSLRHNEVKKIFKEGENKERRAKLKISEAESKKLNQTKTATTVNRTSDKDVKTRNNNVPSKNTSSSSLKPKTVKTTKATTSEKEKKSSNKDKKTNQDVSKKVTKLSASSSSAIKVEIPEEDLSVKSSYKDLIYFEVDIGNQSNRSLNDRSKSARTKTAAFQPAPLSRQGTFTKEDSPTNLENDTEVTEESRVIEENPSTTQEDNEEPDYEDDFEDYESDFEEYVSETDSESGLSSKSETDSELVKTIPLKNQEDGKSFSKISTKIFEEEKKLDSGNYDLSSKTVLHSSLKQKQLDQIKEAISQENTLLFDKNRKITEPSEETANKSNEEIKFDFLNALSRKKEYAKKQKHRSTIILQMIKLHANTIDIYEANFLDETFEDIYRNHNVTHRFTEIDLVFKDEETQTDKIYLKNKWTQNPVSFHQWSDTAFSFEAFLEDQRGYGGDNLMTDLKSWWNVKYNAKRLFNFIASASKDILILLEEEARWRSDQKSVTVSNPESELSFSDGCIPIKVDSVTFLKNRPICDILFSPHDSNVFVSSHRFVQGIEKLPTFTDQFFGRSILCVWSMLEPSQPLHLLVASCQICAIAFDSEYDHFIYAGLTDGSVCLWDLNEPSMYHSETTAGTMEYLLRTPTYCSSHLAGKDYHHNVIVSIKSIGYESTGTLSSQEFNPTQILTMDTDGNVVFWMLTATLSSLERSQKITNNFDSGMSFWGKFKIVMGRSFNPSNILPKSDNKWGLQFPCMSLAPKYNNEDKKLMKSILVGTNIGSIIHFYASGDEIEVPVFYNESGEKYDCELTIKSFSDALLSSICFSGHIAQAGCSDGKVRFYVLDKAKPFKIISSDENFACTPVIKIKWSPLEHGQFFALDNNFCLHFWNICKGDRSPQMTVSLKPLQAAHFDLTCDKKYLYIGLSVQRVKIDIHRLKNQFIAKNIDQETSFFEQYVIKNSNILKHS